MRRAVRVGRPMVGVLVLALLVWRFGAGPFLAGFRAVGWGAVLAACGVAAVTTLASAWRWRLVARGLGLDLGVGAAVAASYRAQWLNTVLPGGVLGDVHRAVRHGRAVRDVGRGARAVVAERAAGQLVQVVVTLAVLLAVPRALPAALPAVLAAVVVVAIVGVLLSGREVAGVVLSRAVLPGVVLASALAVAGYVATFCIAARAVLGVVPAPALVPVALVVLLAMAVPLNLGGWGPREGVAAWSFATVGLGAGAGVATATAYGVLVAVAALPGLVVLAVDRLLVGRRAVGRRAVGREPAEVEAVRG